MRAYGARKVTAAGQCGQGRAGSAQGNASGKKNGTFHFLVCLNIVYGIFWEMQQQSAARHRTSPSPHAHTPWGHTHCPVPPAHLWHRVQSCPCQPAKTPTAPRNGAETDPAPTTEVQPHQPHPAPSCPANPPHLRSKGRPHGETPREQRGTRDASSGHAGETPAPVPGA